MCHVSGFLASVEETSIIGEVENLNIIKQIREIDGLKTGENTAVKLAIITVLIQFSTPNKCHSLFPTQEYEIKVI